MSEAMVAFMTGLTLISTGVALVATFVAIFVARTSFAQAKRLRMRPARIARDPRLQVIPPPFDVKERVS